MSHLVHSRPAQSAGVLRLFARIVCLALLLQSSCFAGQVFRVGPCPTNVVPDGLSWTAPFRTPQTALAAASAGDEIWVAAGRYRGPFTLKDGVALYGGFTGTETARSQRNWTIQTTILDATNDLRRSFRTHIQPFPGIDGPAGLTRATRVDGFTLLNGSFDFGAGIYLAGGSPVFANNTLISNCATGWLGGGAVFIDRTFTVSNTPAITFFTSIADHLVRQQFGTGLAEGIQIYPSNHYSAATHRILQLAANLYDATTNRGAAYPYPPSVFRPVFTNASDTILLCGFVEESSADFLTNRWLDLALPEDRALLADDGVRSNALVYGQPLVIGVKKGFPNFNEFSLRTTVKVARYMDAVKTSPQDTNPTFRQRYQIGISNLSGMEAWNSYTQAYPRPLELRYTNEVRMALRDVRATNEVLLANNIIAFNSSGLFARPSSDPMLQANCVFGNSRYDYSGLPAGADDLVADPQFLPSLARYQLMATSPCVDAGDDLVMAAGWIHGDEPARLHGTHLDLGAHELNPSTPPLIVLQDATENQPATLRVIGLTGRPYTLQGSDDLIHWVDLHTEATAAGFYDFTPAPSPERSHRFFRALLAP